MILEKSVIFYIFSAIRTKTRLCTLSIVLSLCEILKTFRRVLSEISPGHEAEYLLYLISFHKFSKFYNFYFFHQIEGKHEIAHLSVCEIKTLSIEYFRK